MDQPTPEQIRAARHTGFKNSISHRSPADRAKLEKTYIKQDSRREANVTKFVGQIRGTLK